MGTYCAVPYVSLVDVWIMLGMGLFGYVLRKTGFEPAPPVAAQGWVEQGPWAVLRLLGRGELKAKLNIATAPELIRYAVRWVEAEGKQ